MVGPETIDVTNEQDAEHDSWNCLEAAHGLLHT